MAREYRYLLLDVFTETLLLGNPLAVFLDAEGLSDTEMQMLARETNLSETTFCFPWALPGTHEVMEVPVRIFTTQEELPFAGHPTLGTAAALRIAMPALHGQEEVTLRLPVGPVSVRFARDAERTVSRSAALPFGQPLYGEMDQPLPTFGQMHAPVAVAEALGLPVEALDRAKPVQTVSTGLPFVVVPLISQEALGRLAVDPAAAARYLRASDGRFFYVLAPGSSPLQWRARMPLYSGEDPATGSAAGCAIAYLVHHGHAPPCHPVLIEQGVEMGRRSLLHVRGNLIPKAMSQTAHDGQALWEHDSYIRVGGSTVLVAEGRFFLL